MTLTGKRILVTGGMGFLGQHVTSMFANEQDWHTFSSEYTDLTCETDNIFEEVKPNIVIHLAAYCGGIGSNMANPARMVHDNALMACNVVDACHRYGVEKLVTVGSVCAYPEHPPSYPFLEANLWDGYPEPTNAPYGVAKRLLLTLCQAYRQQYGLNAVYLIPANLYGPGDRSDHVIASLIRRIDEAQRTHQDTLKLWGDGTATRDFLHVRDAARAIVLAAEHYDGAEPVNIGTGVATSIRTLAEYLADAMGWRGRFEADPSKPNGQPRRCLNTSRAERLFGFRSEISLSQGLRETVDWFRKNDRMGA